MAILIGWLAGMLVNYLADVLPVQRALAAPACRVCSSRQPAWNLFWPRRCQVCGAAPSRRTWATAVTFTLASLGLWLFPPAPLGYWLGLLGLIYLGLVAVIDLEHRLILHPVSAAGAVIALTIGWVRVGPKAALAGGLAALLLMLGIFLLGELFAVLLSRLRGKSLNEVVFGFGDVLLGCIIGLMAGFPEVMQALFIAILAGGLFGLVYMAAMLLMRRYRLGTAIPYGPFLVLGAIVVVYF